MYSSYSGAVSTWLIFVARAFRRGSVATLAGLLLLALMQSRTLAGQADVFVTDAVCKTATVGPEIAGKASFFEFRRADGFACAKRVIDSLVAHGSTNARIQSSHLFWSLYRHANETAAVEPEFRKLTTAIRLSSGHPLAAHARLAGLRLTTLRGAEPANANEQAQQILADLGFFNDPAAVVRQFDQGHPSFREALRWLVATYYGRWASTQLRQDTSGRMYETANLGKSLVQLGLASTELLKHVVATLWTEGRTLLTQPAEAIPVAREFPPMAVMATYDICAHGNCINNPDLRFTEINDTTVSQEHPFDYSNAFAYVRYTATSLPVVHSTCDLREKACFDLQQFREIGKQYVLGAVSYARGGSEYKNRLLGDRGGMQDHKSNVTYSFNGTIPIPRCTDPAQCSVHVLVTLNKTEQGPQNLTRTRLVLRKPNGDQVELPWGEITRVDRSLGDHVLQLHLSRDYASHSASADDPSGTSLAVGVHRLSAQTEDHIRALRKLTADSNVEKFLPVAIAAHALSLTPAGTQTVDLYYGLGEALGQYADSSFSDRWERVYFPLLYLHLIRNRVGPELTSSERQTTELLWRQLSRTVLVRFKQDIRSQIDLLNGILPGLSVAPIDVAITSIQKEQPLSAAISPLLKDLIPEQTVPSEPVNSALNQARREILAAAAQDNLLEAILLLYAARAKMEGAADRVRTELSALIVEATRLDEEGGVKP